MRRFAENTEMGAYFCKSIGEITALAVLYTGGLQA